MNPETNNQKEQIFKDRTPNLKCENEKSKLDIEGIKVELKPPLTQIHMIKYENQANDEKEQSQNALSICGNIKENSFALNESSTKTAKIEEQNICEICKKAFSRQSYLKLHVKAVHDLVKEHKSQWSIS